MDYLPIFVGVTAAAVVIQAGIMVALLWLSAKVRREWKRWPPK